ncbi:Ltp family lipoprotein [Acinetobacter baumannii]|uniref:Ltp family lipoprotein n=1 Tax=Acinetobacter baumannii TaxID=470 RepID=UPI0023421F31|nr:Ltp family lipoprotein [Acinetobacter baumannii]EKW3202889.1 Ltp family lipoprotein [Acinetobacter baumannii]EKX0107467.1 Ltp family lipoprotein [Acinetobacter baumannii]ELB5354667.1 Ltp family lipoprotein [Acinetobacter baumannii]MCZ3125881.1 Ltp family lipoprotein [Acinetobacter baumannii]
MKKLLMWLGIIFLALIIIGIFAGGPEKNTQTTANNKEPLSDAAKETEEANPAYQAAYQEAVAAAKEANEAAANNAPKFTASQLNAIRTANSYLEYQAFSRKGLINQLSSDYGEGYSVKDATVAVDSLDVDWKEQAAKAAAQYLEQQGFSCKGLINQLASDYGEKFTLEQAKYGAVQAGACS